MKILKGVNGEGDHAVSVEITHHEKSDKRLLVSHIAKSKNFTDHGYNFILTLVTNI